MMSRTVEQWLNPRLAQAAKCWQQSVHHTEAEQGDRATELSDEKLWLGIDLGTCDVVSMVINQAGEPVAVRLTWADVVRDGVVWDFFGAVNILRQQLVSLTQQLGVEFTTAATSFPPGTDPRISVNVLEAAGLTVSAVIDEPSAVAEMMQLSGAAVVDIGGGTTGIAVVERGSVIYSADEATGGHHISLTLAGSERISLEEAEQLKRQQGQQVWPIVRPVFDKMADIVEQHIQGHVIRQLWLAGGSCTLPGVKGLFQQRFPNYDIVLPCQPIFITPLAIAIRAMERDGVEHHAS